MKIDLFKLNNFNKISIDSDFELDPSFYEKMDIRNVINTHVSGEISIGYDDEVMANLFVTGTFILPCAITLEDVNYDFELEIDDIMGKFEDFYENNKNSLDILPFLWENIVSEVPISVVKEGVDTSNLKGEGWELIS